VRHAMGIWLSRAEGTVWAAARRIRCLPSGLRSRPLLKVDSIGSRLWRDGRFGGAGYDGRAVIRCRRMDRLAGTRLCGGRSASS
jgi:hypothetical protein